MSIITYTDFKGEQTIADISNQGVMENLQWFIEEYEPQFLNLLLGDVLAAEFVAGLVLVPVDPPTDPATYEPIDPIWLALRDETELKRMLVCYIYYWYMENASTLTAGTGEVKAKNENSRSVSNWGKQVKAWNKMVQKARAFDLSTDTYPDYVKPYWRKYPFWWPTCPVNEIFYFKNTLNL